MLDFPDATQIRESMETARLLLRRPRMDEAAYLGRLWLDERTQRYLGGKRTPESAAQCGLDVVRSWQEHGLGMWAVCVRGNEQPIGICGPGLFEGELELSYKYFPSSWGHGFATEAARAMVDHLFELFTVDHLLGVTQEANQASRHVLEKLGMRYTRSVVKWDAPQCVYELTRIAWSRQAAS
ncbi:GNAT family N-acetyltransferase [Dictyobacter kobayashii]|uniref:GNAT family acetyltransferase n=1 Tax=Dictyobacter kobayashii TaxID=2014872 RepID=A0A402APX2_9CHLR|nr:GNAT family N-acetyltransferase [Dictyobacter kobayashii]GCE21079.1 GNAT family acetyltransferase [Dictyobacter kobayashii]